MRGITVGKFLLVVVGSWVVTGVLAVLLVAYLRWAGHLAGMGTPLLIALAVGAAVAAVVACVVVIRGGRRAEVAEDDPTASLPKYVRSRPKQSNFGG